MLNSLKFVKGAVSRKDHLPALTHFQIKNGFVKGHNGTLTLCAPIDIDLDVAPKASTFITAIDTCQEEIKITRTPSGRLSIKSGKFKALVECLGEDYPSTNPEGDVIELPQSGILEAFKKIMPFIAEDASRPWARGILLRGQSAYATNNVVLVEYWTGYPFPLSLNIPATTIAEMVRIGQEPVRMQVTEQSVTFFYENGCWLKTLLYSTEWPDLSKILDKESKQTPIPDDFIQSLRNIQPFVSKLRQVILSKGVVSTEPDLDLGTNCETDFGEIGGIFNIDYLIDVVELASSIDLTSYPAPSIFYGDKVRGALIGMRQI